MQDGRVFELLLKKKKKKKLTKNMFTATSKYNIA